MRGRKPKPTALHSLQGTRASASRTGEPQPPGTIGEPPAHLSASAAAWWRFYRDSAPAGLLRSVDVATFAAFIAAADGLDQCAAILARDGLIVETEHGLQEHPASRALARFAAIVIKAGSECGFSPASRPRIQIPEPERPTPFENFGAARRRVTELKAS